MFQVARTWMKNLIKIAQIGRVENTILSPFQRLLRAKTVTMSCSFQPN